MSVVLLRLLEHTSGESHLVRLWERGYYEHIGAVLGTGGNESQRCWGGR